MRKFPLLESVINDVHGSLNPFNQRNKLASVYFVRLKHFFITFLLLNFYAGKDLRRKVLTDARNCSAKWNLIYETKIQKNIWVIPSLTLISRKQKDDVGHAKKPLGAANWCHFPASHDTMLHVENLGDWYESTKVFPVALNGFMETLPQEIYKCLRTRFGNTLPWCNDNCVVGVLKRVVHTYLNAR